MHVLMMRLEDFKDNFEYRVALYKEIIGQQSDELKEVKND